MAKNKKIDLSDLECKVSGCLLGNVKVENNTLSAIVPNPNYIIIAEELGNGVIGLYVGKENKFCKQIPIPRTLPLPEGMRKLVYLGEPKKQPTQQTISTQDGQKKLAYLGSSTTGGNVALKRSFPIFEEDERDE